MKRCSVSVKLLIAALVWFAALMMPGETGAATVRSGVSGGITWSIDGNGKLTLTGTGDYECTYGYGSYTYIPPWCEFGAEITSAEVGILHFGDAHSVRIPVEEKMGRKIMASYLGRSPEMQLFGAFTGIFLREKSFISSIVKSGLVTNASIIIIPFAIFHLQSLSETLFHAHYNNYAFPLVSYLLCDNNCILSICEYPQ